MNEPDPKLLDLQSEVQRLREENVRLRRILHEHDIQLPLVQSPNGIPVTTSAPPSAHTSVLKAEQRIALFRSLLTDLHDLAVRRGKRAKFQMELEKIRQTHAAKESFLRRLAKANL